MRQISKVRQERRHYVVGNGLVLVAAHHHRPDFTCPLAWFIQERVARNTKTAVGVSGSFCIDQSIDNCKF